MMPTGKYSRRVGTVWMLDLDKSIPDLTPLVNATFRRVGLESITELAAARGDGTTTEVRRRFETGRRCYAAWVDSELACYGWVSFNEEFVAELNLQLRFLPGEAYIWDCATKPSFRQNHLYSALLVHIAGMLQTENFCRIWIGADYDNTASHRGIERAGFRSIADFFVARDSSMGQYWAQGKPGVPESLVAEARRVFLDHCEVEP
jgi:ribosomal protein S18 acetylase RimI-like enzyme